MQKVKVTRYVSGRRPEYAQSDSEGEEEEEVFISVGGVTEEEEEGLKEEEEEGDGEVVPHEVSGHHAEDRRLKRLSQLQAAGVRSR